jgi:hypothetical protein
MSDNNGILFLKYDKKDIVNSAVFIFLKTCPKQKKNPPIKDGF